MQSFEQPYTSLTIRHIDRAVKEKLRVRAARHGRSMEAELRSILTTIADENEPRETNLADAIHQRFALFGGVDLEPHSVAALRSPPTFNDT